MKATLKKWTFRIIATGLLLVVLLLVVILNPALTYAHRTVHNTFGVFHNNALDPALLIHLDSARQLAAASELFNSSVHLDICLNDGSIYPSIIETLFGQAFAWGFYNKVVLFGHADYKKNYVELNGYRWNLTEVLAHEMIHCHQFFKRGLLKSNPVANYPNWKWEGYPEYIARQGVSRNDLSQNIEKLLLAEKTDHNGWLQFEDSTGTSMAYYKNWLLIKYCKDILKMNYTQILADTSNEEAFRQGMFDWYFHQNNDWHQGNK